MSRPAKRPTNTEKWPNSNIEISIHLNENDHVQVFETDDRGRVRTYKKSWANHKATVIRGEHVVIDNSIEIPKGVDIFECDIFSSGDTSVIGYPNEKVTLIVHL
ncbi:MAG: hypothetical protein PHV53_10950 [Fermentimonas sp.]|nr:hypothetical protein [Fermentimonas sp.]